MRYLTTLLATLALYGCAAPPTVRPSPSALDTGLTRRCDDEPEIPANAAKVGLSERAALEIIGRYRVIYPDCAGRHARTVGIIEGRDAALAGRR